MKHDYRYQEIRRYKIALPYMKTNKAPAHKFHYTSIGKLYEIVLTPRIEKEVTERGTNWIYCLYMYIQIDNKKETGKGSGGSRYFFIFL